MSRRPLRVLYHFSGRKADTGSPRALINHIDGLDRTRIEPWFLATGEGPLTEALRARGVHVVLGAASPISYHRPIDAIRRVRRVASGLREAGIDLVHINQLGWNFDLVIGAWLRRIPVVLHVHLYETVAFQNLHRFMAKAVILVSEEQRNTMGRFDRIRRKARVIYNPVALDAFANGTPLRESLGLAPTDFVVGTVAQIRSGKGIDVLIETARLLLPGYPQLVFLVIGRPGEGEEAYAERMYEAAKDPALRGRVRFLGSRRDIADLLATMDVFFLPTRIETLSVAVVEAMSAGRPVITTRVGGMTELIPSAELGTIVEPATAEGFASAIARYVDEPDTARAVGERSRARVRELFSPERSRARLEELYSELTGAR